MKRALIVLCFAAYLHADTITYGVSSSGQTSTGPSVLHPTGALLDYSGAFSVPGFDQSLGSLDSVAFDFFMTGSTVWKVLSNSNYAGYSDWFVDETVSFLGASDHYWDSTILGSGGNCLDGCTNMWATLGIHYQVHGVLDDDLTESGSPQYSAYGPHHFSGQSTASLQQFIGNGNILLPLSVSANSYPEYIGGAVLGGLVSGNVSSSLSLTYNYTPRQQISLSEITPAPEPRYFFLLLLAILCLRTVRSISASGTSDRSGCN